MGSIDIELIVTVLVALFAALVMSFAATPVVRSFARRVGAMDVPKDERRMHDHPIPRLGGLAIFLGFILSVVLFADVSLRQIRGVLLGSVVIVVAGVIDDIMPMRAWLKLLFELAAALIAVGHGVVINVVSNPNLVADSQYLILGVFSIPITVLWIVGITNSVNLIDGLDGLSVGVSAIASVTMLVIALLVSEVNVAIIMAALAGACIGFIPYNRNPATIFAGDTGALLLGYVLSTMSIIGFFKMYALISFAVPLLALALPLFDTVFAFVRRILKGQNPMKPDRKHIHHRLIDMGLNQKQAVAILYCISTVLGLSAVVLTTSGWIKAFIFMLTFAVAAAVGAFIMKTTRNHHAQAAETARTEPPSEQAQPEAPETAPAPPDTESEERDG